MKYLSVLIVFICLISFSCKTKEVVSPNAYDGNKLILSHGGGFAGTYTTYCFLDNGQLFKGDKQFKATNPVSGFMKDKVKQIFSNYETLGLAKEERRTFGNYSYSITMVNEVGEEHQLIWEKGQKGIEKYQLFYDNIMNQIRMMNQEGGSSSTPSR